jgi:hypothetical protein
MPNHYEQKPRLGESWGGMQMHSRTLALVFVLLTTALVSAQSSSNVPQEYQDLYAMMDGKVSTFDARVSRSWDGKSSDVQFAAELLVANCNRGR